MTVTVPLTWQDSDAAGFMSLDVTAASEEARKLVEGLLEEVVLPAWPEGVQKRPKALEKHRLALAVFFGELQRLGVHDRDGKRGMADKDFVGQPFGRDVFRRTADALKASGLLSIRGGWRWTHKSQLAGGRKVVTGSSVTAFGLTEVAHERLEASGVRVDSLKDWRTHWARPENKVTVGGPVVELKAKKGAAGAARKSGEYLPVNPEHPKVARFIAELEAHNAFMAGVGVEGAVFYGLKRVFNNGDQDGFDWQWGGRFASQGPAGYESEAKADRLETMRIGGEPVVEIDIRASHPTILHALVRWPLDPEAMDPYSVSEVEDRELVKKIVTQAIGRGDLKAPRWSDDAVAYFAKAHPGEDLHSTVPFAPSRSAVSRALPALGLLWGRAAVHEINFHEAEIITRTMALLREAGLGSLPVHDCLIVPRSAENSAKEALRQAFAAYLSGVLGEAPKVVPALTVERWEV